jgi:CBS domain-containing protein
LINGHRDTREGRYGPDGAPDIGCLPVGDGERLLGMVTDRDLAIRGLAEARHPEETKLKDLLTDAVLYCFDDQEVEEVCRSMGDNQVRRMVVLDRDKTMVGIVSLGDVVDHTDAGCVQETLQRISAAA